MSKATEIMKEELSNLKFKKGTNVLFQILQQMKFLTKMN